MGRRTPQAAAVALGAEVLNGWARSKVPDPDPGWVRCKVADLDPG